MTPGASERDFEALVGELILFTLSLCFNSSLFEFGSIQGSFVPFLLDRCRKSQKNKGRAKVKTVVKGDN
jgi:hypothetical protein